MEAWLTHHQRCYDFAPCQTKATRSATAHSSMQQGWQTANSKGSVPHDPSFSKLKNHAQPTHRASWTENFWTSSELPLEQRCLPALTAATLLGEALAEGFSSPDARQHYIKTLACPMIHTSYTASKKPLQTIETALLTCAPSLLHSQVLDHINMSPRTIPTKPWLPSSKRGQHPVKG